MACWILLGHAYLLGRAIFLWIFKRSSRILYFSSQWTFCTNFFRAFTASADVPSIYPKDSAHPFVLPLAGDLIIDFVKGLGGRHNIHKRIKSPVHITVDDYLCGNLKFVSKGGVDEKALKAGKSKQPAYTKQPKPRKMTTSKPTPSKNIHKGKRSDHLVDGADKESQPATKPQVENDEYNLQRDVSTGPSIQPQDDTSTNVVHDTLSLVNSTNNVETGADIEKSNIEMNTEILYIKEERGEEVSNMMALEERTIELHEAGPNPEPMHEDFVPIVYPEVHESLKLTTEEQVYIENPPSLSGTLSSMRNLDDAFTFVDQFLNDKSLEEKPRKANVETEVESMVSVPIHQTYSFVPPLSTPIIDLLPPKSVSPHV
uniref:Uncharacterized protein n=1 Tax=Tanacetum cinerariifolium TaxID=118510 RepID=A0A699IVE4_TANCI|nr:hypothetical protein [Tanacetum cinerariifolium]